MSLARSEPMFCNVTGCDCGSLMFSEYERNHIALCNVTLGKCIREHGSVAIN
jgi:hypothetical protein